jgi:hypothetical protein
VRVWDRVEPSRLCRQHLLGEHREVHGLWEVVRRVHAGEEGVGYSEHPEARRWLLHVQALMWRHAELKWEMERRGYEHRSDLKLFSVRWLCRTGSPEPLDDQVAALRAKGCECDV